MGQYNNIPQGWVETSLGKLIDIYNQKRIPLSTQVRNSRQGIYPYYGASNIVDYIDDYIFDGEFLLISEDGENLNTRNTPIAFIAKGKFWVNNHAHIVKGKSEHLTKYLELYFSKMDISAFITGAVQPKLSKGNLVNIPILISESSKEQKAIAKVLTAFDDKIELLQDQNKTLETMAQTIFKEWFGKYQIGDELPEGWRVGKLGDIANLKSGYAFKSRDFVEESSKKALKIKDLKGVGKVSLNAVSCVSNDVTELSRVQYFRLKEGDIVLAMSGNTTGKIGVIPTHSNEVYLNQRVGKFFMIKQDLNSFLYSFLMSGNYEEKILSMGYGSAQPNISPSQIENIDIIYPNEEKLVSFLNISNPIFNKVLDNNNQIQSLTKTRDTLLPKLMSGQVRVKILKKS
jgi:type I restriction enzyme S subunit